MATLLSPDPTLPYFIGILKVPVGKVKKLTGELMESKQFLTLLHTSGLQPQRPVDESNSYFHQLTDNIRQYGYLSTSVIKLVLSPLVIRSIYTSSTTSTSIPTSTDSTNSEEQSKTVKSNSLPQQVPIETTDVSTIVSPAESDIHNKLKESWRGRKELDYVDLPSEFKSSLFLFPDGRNRIRAAEIVLEEMVANVKGDDDESTKEERKEKRKRIRGSFIISIAIYGPGCFLDSNAYSCISTSNIQNVNVPDSRFSFGNRNNQEILVKRLAGGEVSTKRADSHKMMYQLSLRTYIDATTLPHPYSVMLNYYLGGNGKSKLAYSGSPSSISQVVTAMILLPLVESIKEDLYFFDTLSLAQVGLLSLLMNQPKNGLRRVLHLSGFNTSTTSLTDINKTILLSQLQDYLSELKSVKATVTTSDLEQISRTIHELEANNNSRAHVPPYWKYQQTAKISPSLSASNFNRLQSFISAEERYSALPTFATKLDGAINKVEELIILAGDTGNFQRLKEVLVEFNGTTNKKITINELANVKAKGTKSSNIFSDAWIAQRYIFNPWSTSLLSQASLLKLDGKTEAVPEDPRFRQDYLSISTPHTNLSHSLLAVAGETIRSTCSPFFLQDDFSIGAKRKSKEINFGSSSIFTASLDGAIASSAFKLGGFPGLASDGVTKVVGVPELEKMLEYEKSIIQSIQSHLVELVVVAITADAFRRSINVPLSQLIPDNQQQPAVVDPTSEEPYQLLYFPLTSEDQRITRVSTLHYSEVQPLLQSLNSLLPLYDQQLPMFKLQASPLTLPLAINLLMVECKESLSTLGYAFKKDLESTIRKIVKDLVLKEQEGEAATAFIPSTFKDLNESIEEDTGDAEDLQFLEDTNRLSQSIADGIEGSVEPVEISMLVQADLELVGEELLAREELSATEEINLEGGSLDLTVRRKSTRNTIAAQSISDTTSVPSPDFSASSSKSSTPKKSRKNKKLHAKLSTKKSSVASATIPTIPEVGESETDDEEREASGEDGEEDLVRQAVETNSVPFGRTMGGQTQTGSGGAEPIEEVDMEEVEGDGGTVIPARIGNSKRALDVSDLEESHLGGASTSNSQKKLKSKMDVVEDLVKDKNLNILTSEAASSSASTSTDSTVIEVFSERKNRSSTIRAGTVPNYVYGSDQSSDSEADLDDSDIDTSSSTVQTVIPLKQKKQNSIELRSSNPIPSLSSLPFTSMSLSSSLLSSSSIKDESTSVVKLALIDSTSTQFYIKHTKDAFSHVVAWNDAMNNENNGVNMMVFKSSSDMERFLGMLRTEAAIEGQAAVIKSYWTYTLQIPVIGFTLVDSELVKEEKLSLYKKICSTWESKTSEKATFYLYFDFPLPLLPDLITTSEDDEIIVQDNSKDFLSLVLYHYVQMFNLSLDPRRISAVLLSLENLLMDKKLPETQMPKYVLDEGVDINTNGINERIKAVFVVLKEREDWGFKHLIFQPIPTWKKGGVRTGEE